MFRSGVSEKFAESFLRKLERASLWWEKSLKKVGLEPRVEE